MIIWNLLVDNCLQCVWKSQPTKWTKMLLLWLVLIFTVNKSWLAMWSRNLHDCIHVCIPAPLRFEHLCNWETRQLWRWIFLANFHFYVPENAIRLAKKQNNNDRKKLKWNCKILFKVKCIQISYKKCLIWPAIERVRYREISARW